ncbi:potassium transporter KefB [uncultured Pontibacter sp.]|uniref:potassium transporter KefB n=1 Tax=uncultured Pontibacter sp. TaxID=453356 RepID=UPI002607A72F|nr:potassium transporter KefB [uncultured Pontibacter sp.]
MAPKHEYQNQPIHPASAGKRMLQGAAIGLALIAFFLLGAGAPNPEWPEYWMIKPLLIVPAAGALGGLFFFNMDHLRFQGGWRAIFAMVLSLAVLLIVLWLGIVLGLHGTMWD